MRSQQCALKQDRLNKYHQQNQILILDVWIIHRRKVADQTTRKLWQMYQRRASPAGKNLGPPDCLMMKSSRPTVSLGFSEGLVVWILLQTDWLNRAPWRSCVNLVKRLEKVPSPANWTPCFLFLSFHDELLLAKTYFCCDWNMHFVNCNFPCYLNKPCM